MPRRLAIAAAAALGLAGVAPSAGAHSLTLVATGPLVLRPGETSGFDVVAVLGPPLGSATVQIDSTDPGAISISRGTIDLAGTGLYVANFALRGPGFDPIGSCGPIVARSQTCEAGGAGAPSAGNLGGLSIAGSNPGTFTIGSFTVQAQDMGSSTLRVRFRPGFEWLDAELDEVELPTTNELGFEVVPEPATAALVGLGVAALLAAGRRRRTPHDPR